MTKEVSSNYTVRRYMSSNSRYILFRYDGFSVHVSILKTERPRVQATRTQQAIFKNSKSESAMALAAKTLK